MMIMDNKQIPINDFREQIEQANIKANCEYAGFDEILCYELHSQPVNPRLTFGEKGLTFKELAGKWGVTLTFLGELIADHCKKLEPITSE